MKKFFIVLIILVGLFASVMTCKQFVEVHQGVANPETPLEKEINKARDKEIEHNMWVTSLLLFEIVTSIGIIAALALASDNKKKIDSQKNDVNTLYGKTTFIEETPHGKAIPKRAVFESKFLYRCEKCGEEYNTYTPYCNSCGGKIVKIDK